MAYKSPADTYDFDFGAALITGESTLPRHLVATQTIGGTAGLLRLTYFTARKTETITQVRTNTGSTGASGATLCRIGVYSIDGSGNLTLIASTANDTALWVTNNTAYTKSFSASFSKTRGTRYAVGTLVVGASTAPTYCGIAAINAPESGMTPRISGYVSGQTDLPSSVTAASITDSGHMAYIVLLP